MGEILDLFDRIVTEKGSALVLEKHVAFLRDKIEFLEKEISLLQKKVVDLEKENSILKEEKSQLQVQLQDHQKQNEILKNRLEERPKPKFKAMPSAGRNVM
jgi:chromosome segregation ATPase